MSDTQSWNELRLPEGAIRPHWRYVFEAWERMGKEDLAKREVDLASLLRTNGVTYNIYKESNEKDWPLDLMPLIIPSSEWASLERGLIQRAELQSLIFRDLNGERRLLAEKILPPEFLFGHPDWMPVACPPQITGAAYVPLVGFDLTRGPDGQWRVLADRVQNPSGAGYALQNRVLLSKVFPSLYREAGVHRLVHWFRALRAELRASAPAGVAPPHVVLLSPGPGHETWFEHSYLATYLGLTLVRGQDLELRGDRLWVRSVGGDRPVDVILRRVNDAWCDPLYLRPDSLLGVPGLVRAVQAGT
ncbi:MAG TPA: circularly permuted type 2 ATP-grasp protein, partial [Fibrobacteraceae bacterium]|nr:circularly permuted type 2 ATP-grasp protein [Fibrobacteraceae bacterium]